MPPAAPRDRNSQAVLMGASVRTSVNETSRDPRKLGCALEGGPTRGMEWGGARVMRTDEISKARESPVPISCDDAHATLCDTRKGTSPDPRKLGCAHKGPGSRRRVRCD